MSDPTAAARAAFLARAEAALDGVASVYDEVPGTPSWPYVALRAVQTIPQETDCSSGSEIFMDFDAWSKALDHSETDAIVGLMREAFRADLVIRGHEVIIQVFGAAQSSGDPDPSIARNAMSLRLETEPA